MPDKPHVGDETYSIINRRKKMKEELENLKSPMTKKRFSYWRLVQSLCSNSRRLLDSQNKPNYCIFSQTDYINSPEIHYTALFTRNTTQTLH